LTDAPGDLRGATLDPDRAGEADQHQRERQPEQASRVLPRVHPHAADPGQLACRRPALLPFATHHVVGRDHAALPEEQELLLAPDGQLAARMAHQELHRGEGGDAAAERQPAACLHCRGAVRMLLRSSHAIGPGNRVARFAPRRGAACIATRKWLKCRES